jgi:hypothetical protein
MAYTISMLSVYLCVCVSPYQLSNGCIHIYETWNVYHGT